MRFDPHKLYGRTARRFPRSLARLDEFEAQETRGRRALLPLQADAPDIEAWLLAKDPRAIGQWDEIGADEHARAFTAARTAGTDIADDLYFGIVDTITRRGTEDDFAKLVTPILRAKGWLGGDEDAIGNRVRLIYDTNLRRARAAGRWSRYQATKAAFPYVRGITAGDDRVRHPPKSRHSDHTAFAGIILPLDHPFVARYWTPFGFRCRCQWVQMTRSQLARYGSGVTSESELAEREARLGPPIFASPVAPISAQLDAMVAPTNASRMPGMPAVDPAATSAAGRAAWQAERDAITDRAIGDALDRLGLGPRPDPAPTPAAVPPPINRPALDKAQRDYVLREGRKHGVEFLTAFDERTGEVVERKRGTKSSVGFSDALVRRLEDKRNAIVLHHNHPGSSSLSGPDVAIVNRYPGARAIYAHGHNGSEFYAEKGPERFKDATLKAISGAIQAKLQALITQGALAVDDAVLMHNHLTWLAMNDLGQVVYSATLSGASAAAWERNATLFRLILDGLKL